MPVSLQGFQKKKDYLICVDSDGCAMDTMNIKHIKCFGPCMVEEWGLQRWEKEILERWNEINLFTETRGINRFKGLAIALQEINEKYCPIDGIDELIEWVNKSPELSNKAVKIVAATAAGPCLEKAFSWSQKVNAAITALPLGQKTPFVYAKEGLMAAHGVADVAVVSSANIEAVIEEWQRCCLLESVDVLCCQDVGSKAHCIEELSRKGYAKDHILMVGDAPGDRDASAVNGVQFYPILVRHEAESWQEFAETALPNFINGNYAVYGKQKAEAFSANLRG